MTIDVITVIPKEARYLFWELFLRNNYLKFDKIITVFTHDEVTKYDYSPEVKRRLPYSVFLDSPKEGKGDWRNIATNFALNHSTADYVLFLEPDFFVNNFDWLVASDNFGVKIAERIHPCFLKLKRSDIEKTSKDFTAYPDRGLDHFDLFTKELVDQSVDISFLPGSQWYHMAGLTHNMRLESQGQTPVYKPDEYRLYKVLESIL